MMREEWKDMNHVYEPSIKAMIEAQQREMLANYPAVSLKEQMEWQQRCINGQHVHRPGEECKSVWGDLRDYRLTADACSHNSNPKSARFCRHCGQRFGWWRRVWGWLFGCLSPSATLR